MGQRHQVFLIARVRPHGDVNTKPKYRCVAALHHQWCYGRLPLKGARRFMTLVSQEDNAKIAAAELDAIQGKYGSSGVAPKIPYIPCPYLSYLLATTWCIDLDKEQPYVSGTTFQNDTLPAWMESGKGDNNDGITIIDVTDPSKPAYCFNMIGGPPMSAEEYIGRYCSIPSPSAKKSAQGEDILQTIAALAKEPMITYEALAEAWPLEYHPPNSVEETEESADEPVETPDHSDIPSFADMALAKAVPFALENGDTTDIAQILWMPDKASAIKSILRTSTMSDSVIRLLMKIIAVEQETGALDISEFALSPEQTTKITPLISHDLRSLDLSNNASLTVDAVRNILTVAPKLQKLLLLGCPAITNADMYHLVESSPTLFYHMEALVHPAFLQPLVDNKDQCPYVPAFTFVGMDLQFPRAVALPYFTPTRIVHALTVLLGSVINGSPLMTSAMQSAHLPQTAFSGTLFKDGQSWNERTVVNVPQYSTKRVGWTFCFQRGWIQMRSKNGFAFVHWRTAPLADSTAEADQGDVASLPTGTEAKVTEPTPEPTPVPEVHDLASFLKCMEAEGRPLPPDDDVAALVTIMQKLQEPAGQDGLMMLPITLLQQEDILPWFQAVQFGEGIMMQF